MIYIDTLCGIFWSTTNKDIRDYIESRYPNAIAESATTSELRNKLTMRKLAKQFAEKKAVVTCDEEFWKAAQENLKV
ncbi:MAG: hypothetical protein ACYCQJ_14555 [Nitrososphaerales archaeon]